MAADPRIRASDDDRDRTASLLREHHAAGRLDPAEFNERLDRVYEAKTLSELDELLSDLPAIDLYRLPDAGLQRRRPTGALPATGAGPVAERGMRSPAWRAAWGSWLTVTVILVVIWAVAGAGTPWFAIPAGVWGAVLLGRWISGSGPHDRGRGHGPHDRRHDRGPRRDLPGDQDQIGGPSPG
ncbi:MAG: DUF1707 domain-containing protein [Streptosporangiaceae bacterium]